MEKIFAEEFSENFFSSGLVLVDDTDADADDGDSTLDKTSSLSVEVSTLLVDMPPTLLNAERSSSLDVDVVVFVDVAAVVAVVDSPPPSRTFCRWSSTSEKFRISKLRS